MPYTYILEWAAHNKRYIGARWSKNCHPNDLWSKYFTSSKYVKQFVKENGAPDIILIDQVFDHQNDAIAREDFLLRKYNAPQNPIFLNKAMGMVYDFNDPDIRKTQSKSRIGTKHSEETKKKIGIAARGRHFSAEAREKMRQKALGHTRNKGKIRTEEVRKKLSQAHLKRWARIKSESPPILNKHSNDIVSATAVIETTEFQILRV